MIRKLACAMFVMTVVIGIALADEYTATITKVDGNKITMQKYKKGMKGKKGEKDGDAFTVEVAKDAKIIKGKFDKDAKKVVDDEEIKDGLKADIFVKATEEKGVTATITTDDDKKVVTKIRVGGKGGKGAN